MNPEFWLWLLLAGAFGGLMAGLLGVGGGVVFVPLITFYVQKMMPDTPFFSAVVMANSFVVILVIGVFGTIRQKKMGQYYPKIILATGTSAILASLLTSKLFVVSGLYSKRLFSLVFISLLCVVLVRFVMEAFRQKNKTEDDISELNIPLKSCLLPGALSGVIAAISGLGGGIILIPYFTQVLKIPVKTATALSLSVITLGAIPLVAFYLLKDPQLIDHSVSHTGFVIWELALPLMIGSALTVGWGVKLSKKARPSLIFVLLSLLVIITIIKMLLDL